jgi:hypothetical protein
MLRFIATYTFTTRDYRQQNAIAILHTLQITVTHALDISIFTSRILATDFIAVSLLFQITHGVFFSQPNSFLAIIPQLPIPMPGFLNLIPLLPSSYPGRMASRNSTRQFQLLFCWTHPYNHFAWTTQQTHPLLLRNVFTDPLPCNRHHIVARVCLRGNVFTETLPSNWNTRHNIFLNLAYPHDQRDFSFYQENNSFPFID